MNLDHIDPTSLPLTNDRRRRLSWWRLLLALVLLAGLSVSSIFGLGWWKNTQVAAARSPWFASYVDVTSTPTYAFEELGATSTKNVVLSFVVASPDDPCQPSWGASYSLDQASDQLDLDRRIARLRKQQGNIVVSFGGLKNDELAVACTDQQALIKAYTQVTDRYDLDTIDLDLENVGLSDTQAGQRRAQAIAAIQSERRAAGKSLAVWLTLPVTPQGLSQDGTTAVQTMLDAKVDLAGINLMVMDFGQSKDKNQSMADAAISALKESHRQLGVLYKLSSTELLTKTLWAKIGATPMIGQNDVSQEVFTLEDAKKLNQFSQNQGLGRMSMWSANRDLPCGENYTDLKVVSDSCSGVGSAKFSFATALSQDFSGQLAPNAATITVQDATPSAQITDNPDTSPYQIWSETGAYLQGTKVVWHKNVYEAKWWTQGDLPDNPVLQAWQTPWKLIGPVLDNEKPVIQPTLAPGTYPTWSGSDVYQTGQRVLFNGLPYQAKWWNQGQSPAAASSNPDSSPWAALTQAQIKDINQSR